MEELRLSYSREGMLPLRFRIGCISTLGLTLALAAQTEAQTPPQTTSHTSELTVNARLVVLDVVATGKNGNAITDLTAADFRVFEDGKPQRIVSFEPPAAHTLPVSAADAGAATVYDPARPAEFGQSPVTILVLDQLNTHFADSSFARRSLHDYLVKQPAVLAQPTSLLTLYDDNFKLLQQFTRDRDKLLQALAAAPTKFAWKLEIDGKTEHGPVERLEQSLRDLEEIAQSAARVPGRKNLIWIGGGFPTVNPTELDTRDAATVKDTLQHITDVLLATRVTLYAVDPGSSAAGMTEITDESQALFADAAGDGLSGSFDPFGATDDFDRLGPVTGGRVVRGLNDVDHQIAAAVDVGRSFYTIGYTPSSASESAAAYRKIRVECVRPGVTLTTRAGYYNEQTQQEKTANTAAYDLTAAAESSLPLNGLRVTVAPDSSVAKEANTYVVRVSAPDLNWKHEADGTATASVYVMAVSLNAAGKMQGHVLHGMTATARPAANLQDESKTADFSITLQPSSRAVRLRFVVRDSSTGRMGTVDLPLTKR